jgi:hypothetical protein
VIDDPSVTFAFNVTDGGVRDEQESFLIGNKRVVRYPTFPFCGTDEGVRDKRKTSILDLTRGCWLEKKGNFLRTKEVYQR